MTKIVSAPEYWKLHVPSGLMISDQGRAKRVFKNGNERFVGFWDKCESHNRQVLVKVGRKDVFLKTIVWETFKGKKPKGMCIAHKNGLKGDNSIYNLYLIKHEDLGKKTGHLSKSQCVADLDTRKVYQSARKAGKALNCSYQMILDICNGKTKKPEFRLYWYDKENMKLYRGKYKKNEEQ